MLPILTSAIQNKISAYKLSKQIFAYPTRSEIIKRAADSFVIQTLTSIKSEIQHWLKGNILQITTAILWIAMLIGFVYYQQKSQLSVDKMAIQFAQFISGHPLGPVIYIVAYAIRPIVLFPATALTLLSGMVFGPLWGFVYTMIGENMSANVAYGLGRIFGKKML